MLPSQAQHQNGKMGGLGLGLGAGGGEVETVGAEGCAAVLIAAQEENKPMQNRTIRCTLENARDKA